MIELLRNTVSNGFGGLIFKLISFCLLFFSFSAISAQETTNITGTSDLVFYTHSLGLGVYEDEDMFIRGREGGGKRAVDIEIVRALMEKLGGIEPIKNTAFVDGLQKLSEEGNVVYFNLLKTPARLNQFKWVGPLPEFKVVFYGEKSFIKTINTVDDARSAKKICVERGVSKIKRYRELGFENLFEVSDKNLCINMLHQGTVDLFLMSEVNEKQYMDTTFWEIFGKSSYYESDEGFIAFSNGVPDSVVENWQKALDEMRANGQYQDLLDKYGFKN